MLKKFIKPNQAINSKINWVSPLYRVTYTLLFAYIERMGVNGGRFLYEFIVRAPFSRRIQELLVIVNGHVIVRL